MGADHSKLMSRHPRAAASAEEERAQYLDSLGGQAIRDQHVSDFWASRQADLDESEEREARASATAAAAAAAERQVDREREHERGREQAQDVDNRKREWTILESLARRERGDSRGENAATRRGWQRPDESGDMDDVPRGRRRSAAPSPGAEDDRPPPYSLYDGAEPLRQRARQPRGESSSKIIQTPVHVVDPEHPDEEPISTQRSLGVQTGVRSNGRGDATNKIRDGYRADHESDSDSPNSSNTELSESMMMDIGESLESYNKRMAANREDISRFENSLREHDERMFKEALLRQEDELIDDYIDENPQMANASRADLRAAIGLPPRDDDYDPEVGMTAVAAFVESENTAHDRSGVEFFTEEEQIRLAIEQSRIEYEEAQCRSANIADDASNAAAVAAAANEQETMAYEAGARAANEAAIETVIWETKALTAEEERSRDQTAGVGEAWCNEARLKMIPAIGAQPVGISDEEHDVLRVLNAGSDQPTSTDNRDNESEAESYNSLFDEPAEEAKQGKASAEGLKRADQACPVDRLDSGTDSGVEVPEQEDVTMTDSPVSKENDPKKRGRPQSPHSCRPIEGWGPASRSPSPDSGLVLSRGPTSQKRPTRVVSSFNDPNDVGKRRGSPRQRRETDAGLVKVKTSSAYDASALHAVGEPRAISAPPTTKLNRKMAWGTLVGHRPTMMPRIHQAMDKGLQTINESLRGTRRLTLQNRQIFDFGNFAALSGRVSSRMYAGAREMLSQLTSDDEGDCVEHYRSREDEDENRDRGNSDDFNGNGNENDAGLDLEQQVQGSLDEATAKLSNHQPTAPDVRPRRRRQGREDLAIGKLAQLQGTLARHGRWDSAAKDLHRKLVFKVKQRDLHLALLQRHQTNWSLDKGSTRETEAKIRELGEDISCLHSRLFDYAFRENGERKRIPSDEERVELERYLILANFQNSYVLRDEYVIQRGPIARTPEAQRDHNTRRLQASRRARTTARARAQSRAAASANDEGNSDSTAMTSLQRSPDAVDTEREIQAVYRTLAMGSSSNQSADSEDSAAEEYSADTQLPALHAGSNAEGLGEPECTGHPDQATSGDNQEDKSQLDDKEVDNKQEATSGTFAFHGQLPSRRRVSNLSGAEQVPDDTFQPTENHAEEPPLDPGEEEAMLDMFPPLTRVPTRGREHNTTSLDDVPYESHERTDMEQYGNDVDYNTTGDRPSLPHIVVSDADRILDPLAGAGTDHEVALQAPSGATIAGHIARDILSRRARMMERHQARNRTMMPGDDLTIGAPEIDERPAASSQVGSDTTQATIIDGFQRPEQNGSVVRQEVISEDFPIPRRGSTPIHWQILDARSPSTRLLNRNRTVTQRLPRRSRNKSEPKPPAWSPPVRARSRSVSPPKRARTKLGLDGTDDYEPYITDEDLWAGDEPSDDHDSERLEGLRDLVAHARYSRNRAHQLSENAQEIQALQTLSSIRRASSSIYLPALGGMPSNTGLTRQAPSPSAAQQQQQQAQQQQSHQQQQQQQQQQQSNGLGGALPNGVPHAGHQTDINYLWGIVQELSDCLAQNRAETAALVERVQGMRERDNGGHANATSPEGGDGGNERYVNGDAPPIADGNAAAEIASLRSQLHTTQSALAQSQAETLSLANTNDDYVAFLHGTMDKLRSYAHANSSATIAIHAHYNGLLEQEREANLQLRLEHGEWQKGLGRASEWARKALRERQEEVGGMQMKMREKAAENRVLRSLVGWKVEDEDEDDDAELFGSAGGAGAGRVGGQNLGDGGGQSIAAGGGGVGIVGRVNGGQQGQGQAKRSVVASNSSVAGSGMDGAGRGGGLG